MRQKIIRDPVHDVIALQVDKPLDGLLFRLINTDEIQRLRRIRQLGLASLAYPGADHSRYSHCLGVMETARRMLALLGREIRVEPEQEVICLAAALLHDLGHGPFSHVFERVTQIHHEEVTAHVILDPDTSIHRVLREFESTLPRKIADFLSARPARTFYNDIVSSQLDADRCDYLLRDNLMTGSQYGNYDLNWLLHSLTVDQPSDRLAVKIKGVSALEAYLQSRYHMYRNVYFHKVVRSAEGMIRLALQRAKRLAVQDRLPWPPKGHAVHIALRGQMLRWEDLRLLDDSSMLECLKEWSRGDDPLLAELCHGLLFRKLFKVIEVQGPEAMPLAREAIARAGGDPDYDVFYDEPSDTPYETSFSPELGAPIFVQDKGGKLVDFSEISPLSAGLNRQLMFRRLHVREGMKETVQEGIGKGNAG